MVRQRATNQVINEVELLDYTNTNTSMSIGQGRPLIKSTATSMQLQQSTARSTELQQW